MIEKLARFDNKQKSVVFDFETCSLNLVSTENKPWQLAFQVYEGEKLLESNAVSYTHLTLPTKA